LHQDNYNHFEMAFMVIMIEWTFGLKIIVLCELTKTNRIEHHVTLYSDSDFFCFSW